MSDLYIDGQVLENVRRNLGRIGKLLEGPIREMEQVDAKSMGARDLEKRMAEFGDEWSYGIGELRKFSAGAVKGLNKIERAFEQLDADLAAALEKAGKK